MMSLLTVLYSVFCEVKRYEFIMTVCGSDSGEELPISTIVLALGPTPWLL